MTKGLWSDQGDGGPASTTISRPTALDQSGRVLSGAMFDEHAKKMGLCPRCGETRTHVRVKTGLRLMTRLKPITSENQDGTYGIYKGYCLGPRCYRLNEAKNLLGEPILKQKSARKKKKTKRSSPKKDTARLGSYETGILRQGSSETEETEHTEEEIGIEVLKKSRDLSIVITESGRPILASRIQSNTPTKMGSHSGNENAALSPSSWTEFSSDDNFEALSKEDTPMDDDFFTMMVQEPSFRGKHVTIHMESQEELLEDSHNENSTENQNSCNKTLVRDENGLNKEIQFQDFMAFPKSTPSALLDGASPEIFTINEEVDSCDDPPLLPPEDSDSSNGDEDVFEQQLAALVASRSARSCFKSQSPATNRYRAAIRPTRPTTAGRHKVLSQRNNNSVPSTAVADQWLSGSSSGKRAAASGVIPHDGGEKTRDLTVVTTTTHVQKEAHMGTDFDEQLVSGSRNASFECEISTHRVERSQGPVDLDMSSGGSEEEIREAALSSQLVDLDESQSEESDTEHSKTMGEPAVSSELVDLDESLKGESGSEHSLSRSETPMIPANEHVYQDKSSQEDLPRERATTENQDFMTGKSDEPIPGLTSTSFTSGSGPVDLDADDSDQERPASPVECMSGDRSDKNEKPPTISPHSPRDASCSSGPVDLDEMNDTECSTPPPPKAKAREERTGPVDLDELDETNTTFSTPPTSPTQLPELSPLSIPDISDSKRLVVANGTRRLYGVGSPSRQNAESSRKIAHSRSEEVVVAAEGASVNTSFHLASSEQHMLSVRQTRSVSPERSSDSSTENTIFASVVKKTTDAKTGIHFKRRENGEIYISKLSESGLFSTTALKVGYRVLSVNNIDCKGKKIQHLANLIQDTKGVVTVVAVRTNVSDKPKGKRHKWLPPLASGSSKKSFQTASTKSTSETATRSEGLDESYAGSTTGSSDSSKGAPKRSLRKVMGKKHSRKNRQEEEVRSVASCFTASTVVMPKHCEESHASSSGSSHFQVKDESFRHAMDSGVLWLTLVGQHVRFPASWFGGARAPHLGVTNVLTRQGEKVPQHRWAYITRDVFHSDPVLSEYVPDRLSPGRLLMHLVIRDEKWRPVQDVAIGCYHPCSPNLCKEKDEDCRVIWMALRRRSGHRVGSTSLIDPVLTSNCRIGDIAMESPLGKSHKVHNGQLRALFGIEPPVQTVFVLETELVKRVHAARDREYISDFKPISLLLLELYLQWRVEL